MKGTWHICKTSSISELEEERKQLRASIQIYKALIQKLTKALDSLASEEAERSTLQRVS